MKNSFFRFCTKNKNTQWWKKSIFYQINPTQFYDSNQDAFGDLLGIAHKISYLSKTLPIDVIHLNSILQNNNLTNTQSDITNYKSINPIIGNIEHLKNLVQIAKVQNIRITMDMPINHSSIYNDLFINNPDYYIWKKQIGTFSNLKQKRWIYNQNKRQYYYNSIQSGTADFDWQNPKVLDYFKTVFQYWIEIGISGFRFDYANLLLKKMKSSGPLMLFKDVSFIENQFQKIHQIWYKIREFLDKSGTIAIGEFQVQDNYDINMKFIRSFYGSQAKPQFHLCNNTQFYYEQWNDEDLYDLFDDWDTLLEQQEKWPIFSLNHPNFNRHPIRFLAKNELQTKKIAILATLLSFTMRGSTMILFGQELGITKNKFSDFMIWDNTLNHGFSSSKQLIFKQQNIRSVLDQLQDKKSTLNIYKKLIKLKKEQVALRVGDLRMIENTPKGVLAFQRQYGDQDFVIVINFTNATIRIPFSMDIPNGKVIFNSLYPEEEPYEQEVDFLELQPYEGVIIEGLDDD